MKTSDAIAAMDNLSEDLETVTVELEDDLHQLLDGEERVEAGLKAQLKEDRELEEATSRALHLAEELERVEQQIERHERAAARGMSQEDMRQIVGHDLDDIRNDLRRMQDLLEEVKDDLEEFENLSNQTSAEFSTFEDIFQQINEALESCIELDEKIEQVDQDYANQDS